MRIKLHGLAIAAIALLPACGPMTKTDASDPSAIVALLSGRTRMTGTYQGKPFATHYRYIDVYVRRGSEWKIVSVQISCMPN